ncbi:MAG: hypothetical protein ABSE47_11940 [Acidimicrobiales bacterium]|jgi:hypothetical protein
MASNKEAKLDRFDRYLPVEPWVNPWQADGSYRPDLDLLTTLLTVAAGTPQQSGIVAAAADVWAAEELRRAGFDPDEVWPRRSKPRVLPRDVRNFVEGGALTKKLRADVEERLTHSKARKALPAEAHVLGSAYSKQADVVVASWAAGVELLISTKTMLSSYQKNLRNRFEEGYGDAKNLRGRHPLAALGFLYLVGADIPEVGLDFAIDMLRKLVREPDVYECACLLIIEGAHVDEDDTDEEARGPEEAPALVPIQTDEDDEEDLTEDAAERDAPAPSPEAVRLLSEKVPSDLSPSTFFERLIAAALDRMPVAVYPSVRARIAHSS